jgi:hypothetical protein
MSSGNSLGDSQRWDCFLTSTGPQHECRGTHADGGEAALELREDKLYADRGGGFKRAAAAHAGE